MRRNDAIASAIVYCAISAGFLCLYIFGCGWQARELIIVCGSVFYAALFGFFFGRCLHRR